MRRTRKGRFSESSTREGAGIARGRPTQEVSEPNGGRPVGACGMVRL